VLVIAGTVTVGAEKLEEGDGARINHGGLVLSGQAAWLLMIETKA
jgi:hypothetical protein